MIYWPLIFIAGIIIGVYIGKWITYNEIKKNIKEDR